MQCEPAMVVRIELGSAPRRPIHEIESYFKWLSVLVGGYAPYLLIVLNETQSRMPCRRRFGILMAYGATPKGVSMQTATAITLFFVAATSALGAARSLRRSVATALPSEILGAVVAFSMTLWCAYLGYWTLSH